MAQRDYVRKKTKAKSNSRIIPNLMMGIAVILVVLFVAILYFVSTNKANKPVTPPQNVTERPTEVLPDRPEERWTYLKELENPDGNQQQPTQSSTQEAERQQILDSFRDNNPQANQTAAATTTSPNNAATNTAPQNTTPPAATQNNHQESGNWLLQCGAFKDKANAESLKAKLAMLGVTGFVKSDKFHRVLVGPYKSKTEAEKTIITLKNNGITGCITTAK